MTRIKFTIKGQVQGVGFRPFIYKLANKLNLKGFVQNNNIGIVIEVEGIKKDLKSFEYSLENNLPLLAKINFMEKIELKPLYKGQFEIIHSELQSSLVSLKTASVPPDIAICDKCKLDIHTKTKYMKYFSTNCTNCGPRYSIIQTVPYDRVYTSMKDFILCKSCLKEYKNPLNRRYHAQPTSCKDCGPKLSLFSKYSQVESTQSELYEITANFIKLGMIGAIKGIGGFHIVCDSSNSKVIEKLRFYKNRPTKPFALMCKDVDMVNKIANISVKEQELLLSKEAPIVLLDKKKNDIVSNIVVPNINKIGCMVAYSGFYHILFEYLDRPIVATSANLGGEPIITTKEDIKTKLPFVDFIVDYNRDIVNAIDDSVVQIVNDDILTMRLSRGYAPKEIILPFKIDKKILALGAMQKDTISLAFDNKLILSPYIGDLDSIKSMEFFEKTIDTFKRFYNFEPDIIICDKHPNYETTKWAEQLKVKNEKIEIFKVQHHLAHLYSVKAEYTLRENYIGFTTLFDTK